MTQVPRESPVRHRREAHRRLSRIHRDRCSGASRPQQRRRATVSLASTRRDRRGRPRGRGPWQDRLFTRRIGSARRIRRSAPTASTPNSAGRASHRETHIRGKPLVPPPDLALLIRTASRPRPFATAVKGCCFVEAAVSQCSPWARALPSCGHSVARRRLGLTGLAWSVGAGFPPNSARRDPAPELRQLTGDPLITQRGFSRAAAVPGRESRPRSTASPARASRNSVPACSARTLASRRSR
jgi:hypothetical protein